MAGTPNGPVRDERHDKHRDRSTDTLLLPLWTTTTSVLPSRHAIARWQRQ